MPSPSGSPPNDTTLHLPRNEAFLSHPIDAAAINEHPHPLFAFIGALFTYAADHPEATIYAHAHKDLGPRWLVAMGREGRRSFLDLPPEYTVLVEGELAAGLFRPVLGRLAMIVGGNTYIHGGLVQVRFAETPSIEHGFAFVVLNGEGGFGAKLFQRGFP
jgi:hypothetical protein